MLIVRPTAYIVPIAEQEFASLTPQVLIVNSGTVGALVTGHVHIYRLSTGLRLYTSELAVSTIPAGTSLAVSALTPWSPPAPADDDYFIMCDCTATSTSPHEPPGAIEQLGPYSFDIKPIGMGPAPAAHGVTHEDGGSDELDLTGLEGLLADPQTPLGHHASHESGGSDEIDVTGLPGSGSGNIEDLPTAEMDDTLVLAPDGAGGVKFRAEAGGTVIPIFSHDFLFTTNGIPVQFAAISSGTGTDQTGSALHPGVMRLSSSTSANSGYFTRSSRTALLIAGGEETHLIFRPQSLANSLIRFGFLDISDQTDPVDGAYIEMQQVGGVDGYIIGRTSNNSSRSSTGTGYTLTTNTWYRLKVSVNADASRVDYTLYDEAGSQLWTDYLTTNIPTSAGRETGCGVIATNSGTTAVALIDLDFMKLDITRTLNR